MAGLKTYSTDLQEVTFRLGRRSEARPFQWVAAIATPTESWQSGHEPDPRYEFETLTVDLPAKMSQPLLNYALRHIGPNATNPEIDHWCHTFAHEVGITALQVMSSTVMGGEQGLADAKARMLFSHGDRILPSQLVVGEHAVVGDANAPHRAPAHSMVGIGRLKGDNTSPNRAIQVDEKNGNLYIGEPGDYLADLRQARSIVRPGSQPELYVQRIPMTVSGHSTQD